MSREGTRTSDVRDGNSDLMESRASSPREHRAPNHQTNPNRKRGRRVLAGALVGAIAIGFGIAKFTEGGSDNSELQKQVALSRELGNSGFTHVAGLRFTDTGEALVTLSNDPNNKHACTVENLTAVQTPDGVVLEMFDSPDPKDHNAMHVVSRAVGQAGEQALLHSVTATREGACE